MAPQSERLLRANMDGILRGGDDASAGRGEGHISAVSAVAFSQRTAAFVVSGGADKLLKVRCLSSLTLDRSNATHS